MNKQDAIDAVNSVGGTNQRLKRQQFDLLDDVANKRTKIASYEVNRDLVFREAAVRMMFVVHETVTTNSTAGDTETFDLSHNLIQTANTTPIVLYDSDERVQPEAVNYAADSFDYSDSDTGDELDVFYVARNPVQIEVEKSAPRAQGNVGEIVFDDVTSMLHERNQNKEPPEMDFDRRLEKVVPKNWTIDIYAKGPVALAWEDDPGNVQAVNAVISLPITRLHESIEGLAQAVKQDIIDREE